jgi:anti-sigma-K factor RskA
MLAAVPERAAPAHLWERVWEGVETENARRRQGTKAKQIKGWRWIPAGAAAAALLAVGLLYRFGPTPPRPPDVFDHPAPYMRYHHLLAQQEVLADAAGLDVLATTVHQREGTWERDG